MYVGCHVVCPQPQAAQHSCVCVCAQRQAKRSDVTNVVGKMFACWCVAHEVHNPFREEVAARSSCVVNDVW
eukprot:1162077-Pelagomonas_calceolata.AAC.4